MNKDTVKGAIDDAAGRTKRQVGEWTGDGKTQSEGAAEQAKGKIQNACGKMKDAGRDVLDNSQSDNSTEAKQKKDKDAA